MAPKGSCPSVTSTSTILSLQVKFFLTASLGNSTRGLRIKLLILGQAPLCSPLYSSKFILGLVAKVFDTNVIYVAKQVRKQKRCEAGIVIRQELWFIGCIFCSSPHFQMFVFLNFNFTSEFPVIFNCLFLTTFL